MRPAGSTVLAWAFALNVVGYPVAGVLAVFLNLPSTWTSFPFRALVVLIALYLLLLTLRRDGNARLHPLLLLFWLAYLLRLLWDSFAGPPGASQALLFFVLTVLLPAGAMARSARGWDDMAAARLVFLIGATVSLAALLLELSGTAADRSLTEATGRLFLDTVNPISFGHAGASTLLAALAMAQSRRPPLGRAALWTGSLLAVACMAAAASRGPVLALLGGVLMLALARRRWKFALVFAAGAATLVASSDFSIAFRFSGLEEDQSALERLLLQANAMRMFAESPLLGAAYAESELNTYPHNVFIESAMALGVAGLIAIIVLNLICLRRGWIQLRLGRVLLPMLFVQYLIGFQLSGALWGSYAYWACAALLLTTAFRPARRRHRVPGPALAPTLAPHRP